mmetsp:Transcript_23349/g.43897  ORF Transcript_23349/g.43897 Transcript_23349/m.43897 type:complete len:358 (-) Transcript_23349:45-1118(-)
MLCLLCSLSLIASVCSLPLLWYSLISRSFSFSSNLRNSLLTLESSSSKLAFPSLSSSATFSASAFFPCSSIMLGSNMVFSISNLSFNSLNFFTLDSNSRRSALKALNLASCSASTFEMLLRKFLLSCSNSSTAWLSFLLAISTSASPLAVASWLSVLISSRALSLLMSMSAWDMLTFTSASCSLPSQRFSLSSSLLMMSLCLAGSCSTVMVSCFSITAIWLSCCLMLWSCSSTTALDLSKRVCSPLTLPSSRSLSSLCLWASFFLSSASFWRPLHLLDSLSCIALADSSSCRSLSLSISSFECSFDFSAASFLRACISLWWFALLASALACFSLALLAFSICAFRVLDLYWSIARSS